MFRYEYFFEQMSIFLIDAITCNDMDLSEAEGQLRTSTFEEKHIYSYWFPLIYLQHCAESWKYALCSLRTTVTNMPPPLLEALRALRAEETETRHQTWLPPSCTGQCTLHCQPGLHLKCVALLTTKRESSSHMPCASWQQAQSNGSIVSSRRAFRAWSTASHCSTLQAPRHMIALWVSPTWSLRRFLDLYSWTMKYKNSVFKKTVLPGYHITAGGPCREPQRVDT